jgi:hypothetical protein
MRKKSKQSGNNRVVSVSIKSILWTAAFRRGFDDVRNRVPYDYDLYNDTGPNGLRWSYERGRQFAFMYDGRLKYGKEVSHDAINRFGMAYINREII